MNKDAIIAALIAALILSIVGWSRSVQRENEAVTGTYEAIELIEWNLNRYKSQVESELAASQKRESVLMQEFNDARERYSQFRGREQSIMNEYETTYNAIIRGDARVIDSLYAIFQTRSVTATDRTP
jgi:hypothetical protein